MYKHIQISKPTYMAVSRCLGISPPSGIPSSGRCSCWPTIFVASQRITPSPTVGCAQGIALALLTAYIDMYIDMYIDR